MASPSAYCWREKHFTQFLTIFIIAIVRRYIHRQFILYYECVLAKYHLHHIHSCMILKLFYVGYNCTTPYVVDCTKLNIGISKISQYVYQ